jgi:hypothetical protein
MQYCVLKVNPALGFLISTCPSRLSSPSPACLPCLALPCRRHGPGLTPLPPTTPPATPTPQCSSA